MIVLIIYLIGYIIAYIICRKVDRGTTTIEQTWKDVINRLGISLFSWLIVIVFVLVYIYILIEDSKPPKWL